MGITTAQFCPRQAPGHTPLAPIRTAEGHLARLSAAVDGERLVRGVVEGWIGSLIGVLPPSVRAAAVIRASPLFRASPRAVSCHEAPFPPRPAPTGPRPIRCARPIGLRQGCAADWPSPRLR